MLEPGRCWRVEEAEPELEADLEGAEVGHDGRHNPLYLLLRNVSINQETNTTIICPLYTGM